MVIRSRWLTAPFFVAVADLDHDTMAKSTEWFMSTEIVDPAHRVLGLSVIVLKHRSMAPDGTLVLFECQQPVLDDGLQGIEVPTVNGRASVNVTLQPEESVTIRYKLVGELGYAGQVMLPTSAP
jgi:hypothetical protein